MEKNLLSSIITSNKSIYNEEKHSAISKKGLYEVYFIIFHNKDRNESYWIRYTLVCNKRTTTQQVNNKGEGVLWFGYFNTSEAKKNFMVKKHYALEDVKGTYESNGDFKFITIGNSFLSLSKAIGNFTAKSGKIFAWELDLSDFQTPYKVVPAIAKTLKISNTINNATHPHITISGTINLNGEIIALQNVPGIQYHTYSDSYTIPWEWFSCYIIKDWPLGYIDFSYKVNKGILEINNGQKSLTPWNTNIIKKLLTSKKLKRIRSINKLNFEMENKNVIIKGEIDVPKEDLLGIEYIGPKGETFYCYNSEIASLSMTINYKKSKHDKFNEINLKFHHNVAFETTSKEPIKGIEYLSWHDEEL